MGDLGGKGFGGDSMAIFHIWWQQGPCRLSTRKSIFHSQEWQWRATSRVLRVATPTVTVPLGDSHRPGPETPISLVQGCFHICNLTASNKWEDLKPRKSCFIVQILSLKILVQGEALTPKFEGCRPGVPVAEEEKSPCTPHPPDP